MIYTIVQLITPPKNPNIGLEVVTEGIKTIKNTVTTQEPEDIPVIYGSANGFRITA